MINTETFSNMKIQINMIIDSLVELIKNPSKLIKKISFITHDEERKEFLIYTYLFKLIINDNDYLSQKYYTYLNKYPNIKPINLENITNIKANNDLELLLTIKEKVLSMPYKYDKTTNNISFNDNTYIDCNYFLTLIILILDNSQKNSINNEINICYTIPSKDLKKIDDRDKIHTFLHNFTFYSLNIKHVDQTKKIKDKTIIILKNAAINYLKHLKQYKHGLENSDSYQIFYNLLKNECLKQGFTLTEQECPLTDLKNTILIKVEEIIDNEFITLPLRKQTSIIENIIWQSSNDVTLLEYMNNNIDNLLDLFTILENNLDNDYEYIKDENNINTIDILLVLLSSKFLLTHEFNYEKIDYSLMNLTNIKPKYMSRICSIEEQDLKNKIRRIEIEIELTKNKLDKLKKERSTLNSNDENYKKHLELCVGNINTASIKIARLNSEYAAYLRQYDELQKETENNYKNATIFNTNYSIIKHICNSIKGCSFYLKTSNNSSLFNNIVVFEDYEKTDNSFYLEISFKDLLKISSPQGVNALIEQNDLPKLID